MLNEMSVMRSPYSREIRPSHKTLLLKSRNNTARSYCTHPTHQSPPSLCAVQSTSASDREGRGRPRGSRTSCMPRLIKTPHAMFAAEERNGKRRKERGRDKRAANRERPRNKIRLLPKKVVAHCTPSRSGPFPVSHLGIVESGE